MICKNSVLTMFFKCDIIYKNKMKVDEEMFSRITRHLGCSLVSYAALFMPIIASAADGSKTVGCGIAGFFIGALGTGFILVSMSSNKRKADKADHYIKGRLELFQKEDVYSHTNKTSRKINNN